MNKKGLTTQVFIIFLSVICILFVVLLAGKFIISFTKDSDEIYNKRLIETLQRDFRSAQSTYLSDEKYEYSTSKGTSYVCFVGDKYGDKIGETDEGINPDDCPDDISTNTKEIIKNSHESEEDVEKRKNIFILDGKRQISHSSSIGEFFIEEGGSEKECLCIKPIRRKFQLYFQNKRNTIWIEEHKIK